VRYRKLGDSDIDVSEISLGSWLTYGHGVERDQTEACTRAAFDAGITFFDTSNIYGVGAAETAWGEVLPDFDRSSYVLATKVFFPMSESDSGLGRDQIHKQLDASLGRLRTDYVDLYQAHRYDHETPLEETMRAFNDLVRQGKVLYIGVSEWRAEEIAAALRIADQMGLDRIVSNQPQYNMIWRVIESEIVPLCEKEGIGQIVWSPIAQGALTGKYLPGAAPPAGSRATDGTGSRFIAEYLTDDILGRVQQLRPVADEAGLTLSQLAVAWTLQNPTVSAAIVGASRPEQVRENVRASGVRLDPAVLARIDDILGPLVVRDPAQTTSPAARP
jgi:aryl-alcohol dehydrogenase-like predicted oxidoreductase